MLILLLKYWRIGSYLALALSAFYAGHYLTSQAWKAELAEQVRINEKAAREGETKLIENTTIIHKAINDAKDSCVHAAVSAAVNDQLRK